MFVVYTSMYVPTSSERKIGGYMQIIAKNQQHQQQLCILHKTMNEVINDLN